MHFLWEKRNKDNQDLVFLCVFSISLCEAHKSIPHTMIMMILYIY